MNKPENKKMINKPNLHSTLRVLHNLWINHHLDIIKIDEILRKDYGVILQYIEIDFMRVETLDGLSTSSIGDYTKYFTKPEN